VRRNTYVSLLLARRWKCARSYFKNSTARDVLRHPRHGRHPARVFSSRTCCYLMKCPSGACNTGVHEGSPPSGHAPSGGTQKSRSAISSKCCRSRRTRGWALYCECCENNRWYNNDPFGDLGRLRTNFFARCVGCDTGIHSKHWTAIRPIATYAIKTGMEEKEVKRNRTFHRRTWSAALQNRLLQLQELRGPRHKKTGRTL